MVLDNWIENSLFTATQCRVLQDVRNAGIVGRVCLEADGEDIVGILSRDV